MKPKKLITLGDGFAFNHYWPMWSQILAEILDCDWQNLSLPGLGNEAISNLVLDQIEHNRDPDVLWLVQWTQPDRLDIEINSETQHLKTQIQQDPVYYKNFITSKKQRTYWSSSASTLPMISDYRKLFSHAQWASRSRQYIMAATAALNHYGCNYRYIFTYNSGWARDCLVPEHTVTWISMREFLFRSKHRDLDIGEIQPVSSVQLDFLEQYVLPSLDYDLARLQAAKQQYLQQDLHRKQQLREMVYKPTTMSKP